MINMIGIIGLILGDVVQFSRKMMIESTLLSITSIHDILYMYMTSWDDVGAKYHKNVSIFTKSILDFIFAINS